MIARHEPARADDHEERRQIEKQRAARCRRPNEAAINQQELEREQRARQDPGRSVPSRLNRGMPRSCVHKPTSTAAITERAADCVSGGISWMASLIATLLKPQLRHSPIVTVIAIASSGRDDGEAGAAARFNSATSSFAAMRANAGNLDQRAFRRKPRGARRALSASAAAPPGASPTVPQLSQIRKTTRSSPRDCARRRRRRCGSRCDGRGRSRAGNRARDRW